MDLTKMLLDQNSACSAVLGVPDRARIIGHIVVVGVFNLLWSRSSSRMLRETRLG